MGFKCGIVGLPNVGKSSLFKMSKCNTVLIETLTKNNDQYQNEKVNIFNDFH